MFYYYLLFYLLSILISSPIHHAFDVEEIVGGYAVFPQNYKYHAAIVGRYNSCDHIYLLGSAAIISNHLLLTSSRFITGQRNQLRKLSFFAVVDKVELSSFLLNLKEIDIIYTYKFVTVAFRNDLAVLQLRASLELEYNTHLVKLEIPRPGEHFHRRSGTVTGYGLKSAVDSTFLISRKRIRLSSVVQNNLTYAFVQNSFNARCMEFSRRYVPITSFCGKIRPDARYQNRGICVGDLGSPLVVENKVYGIASHYNDNCDDTQHGSIYTNISHFQPFIQAIIDGDPLEDTAIHYNFPHKSQIPI